MKLWTTFAPGKVTWELTKIQSKGKGATSDWQKNLAAIKTSLQKLKQSGITGIRLVIYPSEITNNGENINWKPIDTMLDLCKEMQLAVDLCIGPFQYPHYPGIFLPEQLKKLVDGNQKYLDENKTLATYGMNFLKQQLKRYGNDARIHGFHFANEWPDFQRVSGREKIRIGISEIFMIQAAKYLKQSTKKPLLMNTNIDAADKKKLTKAFGNVVPLLGDQAKLGFDIYPSQETWMKTPLQKLRRLIEPYPKSFSWSRKRFDCEIYFTEVEAQPWGNGQSWYQLITNENQPNDSIFGFHKDDLQKTWDKHIAKTSCQTVNLWGSDFWLSADAMKISWPLENVRYLTSKRTDK